MSEHEPPPIVHRNATELPPDELQAECTRYGIASGDASARVSALQLKYDEEYETSRHEYEKYLKRLHLKKVKQEYDEAVKEMKALEQAALARNFKASTMVAQIEANAGPQHLVVRSISPLACCALLGAMRTNTNVLTLDLSNNHLSDVIGEAVGKLLVKNKRLRGLNLGFNALSPHALGPMGEALRVNAVLTSLSIESNPILAHASQAPSTSSNNTNATASPTNAQTLSAFESFMKAIASNTTLTSLNLFNTQMTFDVGRALARALETNTTLIALEIGGNSVAQVDVASISMKIQKNQMLEAESQAKSSRIRREMLHTAEEIQAEHQREAKRKADADWHDANARQRAEQREKEEWERARVKAEEEVRVLLEIEAQQKKYLMQMEEKNAKSAKGKK